MSFENNIESSLNEFVIKIVLLLLFTLLQKMFMVAIWVMKRKLKLLLLV